MKKLSVLLTGLLLALAVAAGLLLPEAVSAILDKTAVTSETRSMDAVNIGYYTDLTLLDKIASLRDDGLVSSIAVSDGQWHDRQAIRSIALSFLTNLMPQAAGAEVRSATPCIDAMANGSSFLVWVVEIYIPGTATCHFELDDVTGAILSFYISGNNGVNLLSFFGLPETGAYSSNGSEENVFLERFCQALTENYADTGVDLSPVSGVPFWPDLPLILSADGTEQEVFLYVSEELICYP